MANVADNFPPRRDHARLSASLLAVASAAARAPAGNDYVIRSFKFGGETLPELRLHITLGVAGTRGGVVRNAVT